MELEGFIERIFSCLHHKDYHGCRNIISEFFAWHNENIDEDFLIGLHTECCKVLRFCMVVANNIIDKLIEFRNDPLAVIFNYNEIDFSFLEQEPFFLKVHE